MDLEILNLIAGNGVGVTFGFLMYQMASKTLKEHTKAIQDLIIFLKSRK